MMYLAAYTFTVHEHLLYKYLLFLQSSRRLESCVINLVIDHCFGCRANT